MVLTKKFSEFTDGNLTDSTNEEVGLSGGANAKFQKVTEWTTATRPNPPFNGLMGYNTDLDLWEYYDGSALAWIQFVPSPVLDEKFIVQQPSAYLPNAQALSALSTGILKSTTATGVLSISAPLTSIDGLTTAADEMIYLTAPNTYATTALTAFARGFLADSTAAAGRTTLGLGQAAVKNVSDNAQSNVASTLGAFVIGHVLVAGDTAGTVKDGGSPAGMGTVTSITAGTGLTGGTITTSGTIALDIPVAMMNGGTGAVLTPSNGGIVYTTASAMAILSGTATPNLPLLSGASAAPTWSAYALVLGGDLTTAAALTTVGNFAAVFNFTGITDVTFPTSGTLATTGDLPTLPLSLADGGTGASLVASNGGIFYSNATTGAILAGTATANQVLLSGSSSAPAWSTATYPATTTINQILYSSANNTITGLATANDGVLITSAGGVPSISSTLPNTVQDNITRLGTITSGIWNGTAIGTIYGGTGLTSYTLGDTLYASAANTLAKLAGNTTVVKQYLSQTGDGVNSAAPVWATISGGDITGAALTKTDDTNVTLTLGGTPSTALLRSASLTLGWTGQLAVSRGGTGAATLTGLLTGNGTSAITATAITQYNVLTGGASNAPNSVAPSATSGVPLISQGSSAQPVFGTAVVAGGGTGLTSATAYAVLCGGTTSTGAFQSVASVGSAGQVLTSNGAGALPSFQNASGTGTVNSGTANQLAYYATTGSAVSGLATANNGVLVTSGAGVPSISSTLPSSISATSMILTTPNVITSINDTNGNEVFKITATASAVNEFTVINSATGNAVQLNATGGDANVGIQINAKGSGTVSISGCTDASDASSPYWGQVLSSNVLAASAVSLTTDTTANVTSLTLTPGDWDVWGVPFTYPNGSGAVTTNYNSALSLTSATLPTHGLSEPWSALTNNPGNGNQYQAWTIGPARINVSTNTTVYMVVNVTFTSTLKAYGFILARRRR